MRNGVWVFELNSKTFYQDLQVHGAIKTLKCGKVRAKDHPMAMLVLDAPGWYPGKTRFLGKPWEKVPLGDPE